MCIFLYRCTCVYLSIYLYTINKVITSGKSLLHSSSKAELHLLAIDFEIRS